jgi:diguanylate cyclase (GGDEF)-like protein
MSAAIATEESPEAQPEHEGRRHAIRVASFILWGLILGYEIVATGKNPSFANVVTTSAFILLFISVNLQMWLQQWSGNRNWHRVMSRLHGSSYISEAFSLPNRNYLLAELRREMPRARAAGLPFVLVQVSLDTIDDIRKRRGQDYANRSVTSLAEVLKRVTRNSDFIAHTGGATFCVVLNECSREQCQNYLQRVPGMVAVSDGRHMFDVPTSARISEYDMESLYATDVLRDVEEATPLRRREEKRAFTEAA